MIAREAHPAEDFIGGLAREMLTDEVFGHDPAGGRGARPEEKRSALDARRKILGQFQTCFPAGDEIALEIDILRPLSDGFRARNGMTGLDSREATEPRQLD